MVKKSNHAGMFSIPDPDKAEEHAYKKKTDIDNRFITASVDNILQII